VRLRRVAAIATTTVLMLASCGGGADDTRSVEFPELRGDAGVAPGEIKVGILTDFSEGSAPISRPLVDGQLEYWRSVNERSGGIAGRKVTPVVVDVKGNGANIVPGFERLVAETAVISSLFGSPEAAGIVEQAKAAKIVMSPTIRSSALANDPQLMLFTTPYRMQTANAVDWLVRNPPERPEPDGATGEPTGEPAEEPTEEPTGEPAGEPTDGSASSDGDAPAPERKFALVASESSIEGADARRGWNDARGTGDEPSFADAGVFDPATSAEGFDQLVGALVAAGATDVVFGAPKVDLQALLEATDRAKAPLRYVVPTDAWNPAVLTTAVRQLAGERVKVIGTIVSFGEEAEGMGTLVNTVRQRGLSYASSPDKWFVVGWVQARAVEALLRRAAVDDGDLTRDGLLATLGRLGRVPMEGLQPDLDFGDTADTRVPTRASRVWEVSPDNPDDASGLSSISRAFTSTAARDADVQPAG
jgi:hypothetical protein